MNDIVTQAASQPASGNGGAASSPATDALAHEPVRDVQQSPAQSATVGTPRPIGRVGAATRWLMLAYAVASFAMIVLDAGAIVAGYEVSAGSAGPDGFETVRRVIVVAAAVPGLLMIPAGVCWLV